MNFNKDILTILLCFYGLVSFSQNHFRTIVTQEPVLVGESFQVQFIIETDETVNTFIPPSFRGFRYVTGPNKYNGSVAENDKRKKFQNFVYTLTALKKGKFIIQGAIASIKGQTYRSNDVFVEVASLNDSRQVRNNQNMDHDSEYFLRPEEDPWEKIRKNLFLNVLVDRYSCFVGEPIVATFKLYSRLESKTDILKNPGFYGFSVFDVLNLHDQVQATEIIKNRSFDVHVIRKVQLYPYSPGDFTIDAMEVQNQVEFSKSFVNKKTEQEITENITHTLPAEKGGDIQVFENTLKTNPIPISIKALPVGNKPSSYSGAVGEFSIRSITNKSSYFKNEQGTFNIIIEGRGNFIQLDAPIVEWPAGLEGYDPIISDSLNKSEVPLAGKKSFRYSFVVSQPGKFRIPSIQFSFFNPIGKQYKIISTEPLNITVNEINTNSFLKPEIKKKEQKSYYLLKIIVAFILATIFIILWVKKQKTKRKNELTETPPKVQSGLMPNPFLPELLQRPVDKNFYITLFNGIWLYLQEKLQITTGNMNKKILVEKLKDSGIEDKTINELIQTLDKCELAAYTDAFVDYDAAALYIRTRKLLLEIDRML